VNAGVAAGHPATAAAGVEILADGGSAADAAVAAAFASCVAETVMTGLLGGGHGVYYDRGTGVARNLDCFCAVPGLGAPRREPALVRLQVPFGAELVHYAIGAASCAVPGVPAGLGALWESHGRLPWPRLLEPALALARDGVPMPRAHVACLRMLELVMTMREGADIYAPGGAVLREGELLRQPGLVAALESLAGEGPRGAYEGTIGRALLDLCRERDGLVTESDLRSYRAMWDEPVEARWLGRRVLTRAGLSGIPETLARLPSLRAIPAPRRVVELVDRLGTAAGPDTHTTNLVAVDADGNVCVLTTSLGLGSGDWLPGLDVHLNSMLGEADLIHGPLEPGERMESMMAPSLVLDGRGVELALGAAGGTRLRTALLTVALAVLDEGLSPQEAVDLPRVHPADGLVNAEPGVDEDGLVELESRGVQVRRWPERHHYFGGVSAIGRSGAGADPRRSGAVLSAPEAG
jgi:gamma-glutamyltranspeptidase/glutathione hydrolase